MAWNVLVLWCDGIKTWEPLRILKQDDLYSLTEYAIENDLLGQDNENVLQRYAKNCKKLTCMLQHVLTQQAKHVTLVPSSYQQVVETDKETGTLQWNGLMHIELDIIAHYESFTNVSRIKDLTKHKTTPWESTHSCSLHL